MLSALPGAAVTSVKLEGALHEFTTIPHMREEVNEFFLNLKGLRLRPHVQREGRLRIEVEGQGIVTAGDVMASSDFEVVNPEHYLATLDSKDAKLSVELKIEQGVGFRVAKHDRNQIIGEIAIDAIFTPIRRANFKVEPKRVGDRTDLESLIIETWTDGSLKPIEAVNKAAEMLSKEFLLISSFGRSSSTQDPSPIAGIAPEVYNLRIEDLGLSARTVNSLRRAGMERVADVLNVPSEKLAQIRNFGKKSLTELTEKLVSIKAVPGPKGEEDEE